MRKLILGSFVALLISVVFLLAIQGRTSAATPACLVPTPTPPPTPTPTPHFGTTVLDSSASKCVTSVSSATSVEVFSDDLSRLPTPNPNPNANGAASVDTLTALFSTEQQEITRQMLLRGLRVVTQEGFDQECQADANAVALHWSLVDPSQALVSNTFLAFDSSTAQLYWYLVGCDDRPVYITVGQSKYSARVGNGHKVQYRLPMDFISSIMGLLSLFHPGGVALVSASLTGGVSAVGGGINTVLGKLQDRDSLERAAFRRAAWDVANDYCISNGPISCLTVRKP